jgi:transposase InsO family protein
VTAELRRRGRPVNRKRVERIMRERGIVGVTRRRRCSIRAAVERDLQLLGEDVACRIARA